MSKFLSYCKCFIGTALVLVSAQAFGATAQSLTVGEGFVDPVGYHNATPTFSWKLPEGVHKQTAYHIEAKAGEARWDSGWVESDQSTMLLC
jgi:alpha-L-rhamnosidase